MSTRRRVRTFTVVIFVASWFITGCTTGFVQEAAQSSLASFVIDVFSTAVNDSIKP